MERRRSGARFRILVHRRVAVLGLALSLPGSLARAEDPNVCDVPGEAPDLIVGDITSRVRWGSADGITAFSFGANTCNTGSCWASWSAGTSEHPVTGQNLFRLENGRFEQIGQSWVMHGFFALSGVLCSAGCLATDGAHLGVHCSTTDSANFLGYQPRLGPKFEVDPDSGVFPFPATGINGTGGPTYKRLQVHDADLDPALHAGAQYFVELQIVSHGDAAAGRHHNNASYRPALASGLGGVFDLSLTGTTAREQPALMAWSAGDPEVVLTEVDVPGDGLLIVGAKVSAIPGGWHYEYAVQNLDSHRSAAAFLVPLPPGAVVTNMGFHDVDYHSGEPFSPVDWNATVSEGAVIFSTEPYEQNPNANALRWGTLYNFRFDCDVPPATGDVTLRLFRPGAPAAVTATTRAPRLCATVESGCGNQVDDDCDGRVDCLDADCCRAAACAEQDADGDTRSAVCDCDDANPGAWSAPGEASGLSVIPTGGAASLFWAPPVDPGGAAVTYDLLRSPSPADFETVADCLFLPNPSNPAATDAQNPPPGGLFGYLVRARNGCPGAPGDLGTSSNGQPRHGRSCP